MPPSLELVGASLLGSWLSGAASPATGGNWALWAFAVASVGFIALLSCVLGCICGAALACWCSAQRPCSGSAWCPTLAVLGPVVQAAAAQAPRDRGGGERELARRLAEYNAGTKLH